MMNDVVETLKETIFMFSNSSMSAYSTIAQHMYVCSVCVCEHDPSGTDIRLHHSLDQP